MAETVSISVSKTTRDFLRRYSKKFRVSYDEALRRLLGELPEEGLAPEEAKRFLDSIRKDPRLSEREVLSKVESLPAPARV